MYNNDRKQAYIEKEAELRKLEDVRRRYIWVFRRVEPYEEKYNKDVSEFSYEEIMEMYKDIGFTLVGMQNFHTSLKSYAASVIEGDNGFLLVTSNDLKKYFDVNKKTLVSYEDVVQLTNSLLNPMDKFFIYGLFCGVRGANYCELNYSTMDGAKEENRLIWLAGIDENGDVKLKSRSFIADEKLFTFAQEASSAKYLFQYTKNGVYKKILVESGNKKIYKLPYTPLECHPSQESEQTRVKQRLKNLINNNGLGGIITPLDIYWSGIVYSIQKKAIQKGVILKDLKDYLNLYAVDGFEDIQEQYDVEFSKRYLKSRLERYL